MTTQFDFTQPVRTRDGRPARIVCTNARGRYPIVALVAAKDGTESPISFTAAGRLVEGDEDDLDLVNIPPEPRRLEVNLWLYAGTREDPDAVWWAPVDRVIADCIGSVRVTLVEGQWAEGTKP